MIGDDDIKAFYNTDEFASNATWTHSDVTLQIPCIFDTSPDPVNQGSVNVMGENPQAQFITAMITGMQGGDTIVVEGKSYTVSGAPKPINRLESVVKLRKS